MQAILQSMPDQSSVNPAQINFGGYAVYQDLAVAFSQSDSNSAPNRAINEMMLARILGIVGSLLLSLPSAHRAQGVSTIEFQDVQIVPSLAGVVHDPADTPMAGVLVEEFSSDWKTTLRSTKTDRQGRFAMTTVNGRKTYFLQLSFRNCNPIRVRVKVDAKRGKELQVKMVNST